MSRKRNQLDKLPFVIDASTFELHNFSEALADYKVLEITNCKDVSDVKKIIVKEFFADFPRCIVIDIAFADEAEDKQISKAIGYLRTVLPFERPIVIQAYRNDASTTVVAFREVTSAPLTIIRELQGITKEAFDGGEFSFEAMLRALSSGIGGQMNGRDLLTVNLDLDQSFMEKAVSVRNVLIIRYLKLFQRNEKKLLELLTLVALKKDFELFAALIDLSVDEKSITYYEQRVLSYEVAGERNLLQAVAECNDLTILKYLIDCGFDINYKDGNDKSLADYVLSREEFPATFIDWCKENNEEHKHLWEECKARKNFHRAIEDDELEPIKLFLLKYPSMTIAYGPDNKTALKLANDSNSNNVLAYLIFKGFSDPSCMNFRALLDEKKKATITELMIKFYGKQVDSHILFLVTKSRLCFSTDQKQEKAFFDLIKKLFEDLNKIPEISSLLKVLEHSKTLQIMFDFTHASVEKVNLLESNTTRGITNHENERIYIGADQKDRDELLGLLAHELAHLAMQIIFNNDCKPYEAANDNDKETFLRIVLSIHELKSKHRTIEKVYTNYLQHDWPKELIVRVPQMLAQKASLDDNRSLQKFYIDKVLVKASEFLSNTEAFNARRENQELNNLLGCLKRAESIDVQLFEEKLIEKPLLEATTNRVITSNVPQLILSNFIQSAKNLNIKLYEKFIFLSIKDLENLTLAKRISTAWKSNPTIAIQLIVDCTDYEGKINWNFFKTDHSSSCFTLVCENSEKANQISRNLDGNIEKLEMNFQWNDFKTSSKKKLINVKVKFQGETLTLSKLLKLHSTTIHHFPLNEIIKGKLADVGKEIELNEGYNNKYFIERSFLQQEKKIGSLNELLETVQSQKLVLISDESGMGKSTILSYIAMRLKRDKPNYWILKIDLNKHIKSFKDNFESHDNNWPKFIGKHFAEHKNKFEEMLFDELYTDGRVILMLDSYDDISSDYKDQVMLLLNESKKSTIKQVWMTTRSHLRMKLEKELKITSIQLQPFTNDESKNFLVSFWKCHCNDKSEAELKAKAEQLIHKIHNLSPHCGMTGLPKMMRTIAEEFQKKNLIPRKIDIFWLFEKFFIDKTSIFATEMRENSESVNCPETTNELINGFMNLVQRILIENNKSSVQIHKSIGDFFNGDYLLEQVEDERLKDVLNDLFRDEYEIFRNFLREQLKFKEVTEEAKLRAFTKLAPLFKDDVRINDLFHLFDMKHLLQSDIIIESVRKCGYSLLDNLFDRFQ